ncbi:NAD(P)/FAD-dependent oxidoreductase [Sporosarcina sp. 179-K 3D1 HS]|uniref:NAD(P)/FAD-dependent oxidoreductase n=1 Tax=Sporosarcina sp. 179-K 3D1 HS TaxID=3232169 RepID=UPI0039A08CDD
MDSADLFDVTIIGGGPAGMFSAFYAGLREMKTKIIEAQPQLGGKVTVYPEKIIWDVGGLTPIRGAQLIEQLTEQALTFEPTLALGEKVTSIARSGDGTFIIHTSSGEKHFTKTIILAIGGGILKPIKLEIEGAERYEVTNLHYTVQSLERFRDKTVLLSGGGNAAVDWANELEPIAKKVYLTYRNDTFKAHEAEVSKLVASSVECLYNTTIEKLIASPDHERIETVILQGVEGQESAVAVDEVVVNHGFERERELLENSEVKVEIESEIYVAGNPVGETSVPGVFAAGDVLHHEGKLKLIAGAFHDAGNAVNRAKHFISPEAGDRAVVSTHNERFKERNRVLANNF